MHKRVLTSVLASSMLLSMVGTTVAHASEESESGNPHKVTTKTSKDTYHKKKTNKEKMEEKKTVIAKGKEEIRKNKRELKRLKSSIHKNRKNKEKLKTNIWKKEVAINEKQSEITADIIAWQDQDIHPESLASSMIGVDSEQNELLKKETYLDKTKPLKEQVVNMKQDEQVLNEKLIDNEHTYEKTLKKEKELVKETHKTKKQIHKNKIKLKKIEKAEKARLLAIKKKKEAEAIRKAKLEAEKIKAEKANTIEEAVSISNDGNMNAADFKGIEIFKTKIAENHAPKANIGFIKPVDAKFTGSYGYRTSPLGKGAEFHLGVDLAAPLHTPVYASMGGTVVTAEHHYSYGNYIKIKHHVKGKDYYTLYAHLSEIGVKVGQKVKQGELIALVGSTGDSTGYHLHFEVHDGNDERMNPEDYVQVR